MGPPRLLSTSRRGPTPSPPRTTTRPTRPPASYSIGVTLSDAFGKTAFAQTTIAINNPAVDFASPGLVLSSTSIVEGGTVNVSGTVVSPDGDRRQHGLAQLGRRLRADHDRPPCGPGHVLDNPYLFEQSSGGWVRELYDHRFRDQPVWPGWLCVGERDRQQSCPAVHRGRPELVADNRQRGRHDHA